MTLFLKSDKNGSKFGTGLWNKKHKSQQIMNNNDIKKKKRKKPKIKYKDTNDMYTTKLVHNKHPNNNNSSSHNNSNNSNNNNNNSNGNNNIYYNSINGHKKVKKRSNDVNSTVYGTPGSKKRVKMANAKQQTADIALRNFKESDIPNNKIQSLWFTAQRDIFLGSQPGVCIKHGVTLKMKRERAPTTWHTIQTKINTHLTRNTSDPLGIYIYKYNIVYIYILNI